MAGQKVSRKALKTKNQIGTVLAELLQEKELRDITVQEIFTRLFFGISRIIPQYSKWYSVLKVPLRFI